jgi:AcrR family transcriptional regulator
MPRIAQVDGRRLALDAALALFYERGHEAVSVETVAQAAGLTKKALYYHFPTKLDLVLATLEAAQQPVLEMLQRMAGTPPSFERVLQGVHKWLKSGRCRGCLYLRAARSYPDVPQVHEQAARQKDLTLDWLVSVARTQGAADPQRLALQFRLLLDGMLSTAHLYDADELAATARAMWSAITSNPENRR